MTWSTAKVGESWLYHGDCLEGMKSLPDQTVNLILADLPYGTTNITWDSVIPFDLLWKEYRRVLSGGGCVVLFGSGMFTARLMLSKPDWYKYDLVWDKNKCGSPGLAKVRPMRVHEDILIFAPGKTVYNPQMETGEAYSRRAPKQVRCNNHGYGFENESGITNEGTRYPKSVLKISRDFSAQQQVHPTQKPVPLLEWLIKTYSNERDTVLDNVMGSGSTGVAAANTNRRFIGMEREQSYFEIAKSRICEAFNQKEK